MEVVDYRSFGRCARLQLGEAEAYVTLDLGPRVIRFGRVGGPNLFCEFESGDTLDESGFRLYGGHRLWVGPEDPPKTYQPDNDPLEVEQDVEMLRVTAPVDGVGFQKSIQFETLPRQNGLRLIHRIKNTTDEPVAMFPWTLTVMAPGGECLFPQPEFQSHDEAKLPAAPIVLWGYSRMGDPRWTWGSHVVRLRQVADMPPVKVGALVKQGVAAYLLRGDLFLKRFEYLPHSPYPDMGVNFETFTRHDMLEVESVGPERVLGPGETVEHVESWYLVPDAEAPMEDEQAYTWLMDLAEARSL